jgi:hypothetical protein
MLTQQTKVPAIAIHSYYKNYEEPTIDEGFDDIIFTSFVFDPTINNTKLLLSYLL